MSDKFGIVAQPYLTYASDQITCSAKGKHLMPDIWKKCSACKKEIPVNAKYYECSVSTCNGKRTGLVFCSIPCFERHLPGARHKDAAAIEAKAPSTVAAATPSPTSSERTSGTRRIIPSQNKQHQSTLSQANTHEILVVVSKLKKYVQDRSGMNTSQSVMATLSDRLRRLCDEAIEQAKNDGRKTLMDRDFKK